MSSQLTISAPNVSLAWARTFLELMSRGSIDRQPALVSVVDIDSTPNIEEQAIRDRLDGELGARGLNLCGTVGGTIFPRSMWNEATSDDATELFRRYEKAWPAIERCPANRRGVYFRRLTSFSPKAFTGTPVNQLEFIAKTYQGGNHRRSALQATIFDPTRDHSNSKQRGFPCLQYVAFVPMNGGKLAITALYALQYQFEKAYGNYLGLYWLGRFMAKQFGLTLTAVNCFAASLTLGDAGKRSLRTLEHDVRGLLSPAPAGR